jgi:uncharacterized paraquat-inducible protein A
MIEFLDRWSLLILFAAAMVVCYVKRNKDGL